MKDLKEINKILQDHEKRIRVLEAKDQKPKLKKVSDDTKQGISSDLVLNIINKIGECDESEKIQANVLDKTSMEGKILLCFHISYRYFKNARLTTGDIEKITSELGTKITVGNVSNKITGGLRKYLESGTTRKHGAPTPYRLNRKGAKRFKEIIHVSQK